MARPGPRDGSGEGGCRVGRGAADSDGLAEQTPQQLRELGLPELVAEACLSPPALGPVGEEALQVMAFRGLLKWLDCVPLGLVSARTVAARDLRRSERWARMRRKKGVWHALLDRRRHGDPSAHLGGSPAGLCSHLGIGGVFALAATCRIFAHFTRNVAACPSCRARARRLKLRCGHRVCEDCRRQCPRCHPDRTGVPSPGRQAVMKASSHSLAPTVPASIPSVIRSLQCLPIPRRAAMRTPRASVLFEPAPVALAPQTPVASHRFTERLARKSARGPREQCQPTLLDSPEVTGDIVEVPDVMDMPIEALMSSVAKEVTCLAAARKRQRPTSPCTPKPSVWSRALRSRLGEIEL